MFDRVFLANVRFMYWRTKRQTFKEYSMKKFLLEVVGITPLMMDMMSEATLDGLDTGIRAPEQKDRPSVDKAKGKIYRTGDGVIALPIEMLIGCLISGGQDVKNGKKQISTAKTTTLFDFLTILSVDLPLVDPNPVAGEVQKNVAQEGDLAWVVDKRKGIGNQAKVPTAVCITRPKFPRWGFSVEIEYDEKKINIDTLKKLFEVALSSKGLGAFRPNKRGPFGRSEVIKWTELTDKKVKVESSVDHNRIPELAGAK